MSKTDVAAYLSTDYVVFRHIKDSIELFYTTTMCIFPNLTHILYCIQF